MSPKAEKFLSFSVLGFIFVGVPLIFHCLGIRMCILHNLTGYPCPSCGSTRAGVFLLKGRVGDAFAIQPLFTTVAFLVAGFAILWLVGRFLHRDLTSWVHIPRNRCVSIAFWTVCVASVIANWIYVIRIGN